MMTRLTQKMETFCLKYCELGHAAEAAIQAGYSKKSIATIAAHTMKNPLVIARIAELRQKAEDASVMTVQERKQKLSDIGRADVTEFVDQEGNIDLSGGNTGALAEIQVEDWRGGRDGESQSRTKRVKVHPKIQAIQELNMMDGVYTEGPQVHIDNRKIEITVVSERAKELTEGIVRGDRT